MRSGPVLNQQNAAIGAPSVITLAKGFQSSASALIVTVNPLALGCHCICS
jgi:hypothetical protein